MTDPSSSARLIAEIAQIAIEIRAQGIAYQQFGDDHGELVDLMKEWADRLAAIRSSGAEPTTIDCPACGETVKQVASATLSLALWQHYYWKCTAGSSPSPAPERPAPTWPPVMLQDGPAPEWTCPTCGKDGLFCEHAGTK